MSMLGAVRGAQAFEIRVRGRVQGVGFRPAVWRIARELGLAGEVLNDSEGVLLRVRGDERQVSALLERIRDGLPPLASIDRFESHTYNGELPRDFRIVESRSGGVHTQIAPDAAICAACTAELNDRSARRYRYPFTNCTHCGPRLTIVTAIPYDRATTTMARFPLCTGCRAEYENPADRRFHAEATACPECGPRAVLVPLAGTVAAIGGAPDDVARAADLIRRGAIVAIKGLGGYHLACDATNEVAVSRLRHGKRRNAKPFALMARDLAVIARYSIATRGEEQALAEVKAPIVLMAANGPERLPEAIAPGLNTLGFMLPATPLHYLLLQDMDGPLVMTSGNISEEPVITSDDVARERLAGIADYALMHDRDIANRVDDSVVRIMAGKVRVLRRARGFAPEPVKLPEGFHDAPDLLALGGELKAAFCLLKDGHAILSQHQGDLENAATYDDYCKHLALYRDLFDHKPEALIIDGHPEYLSTKWARAEAGKRSLPLIEVQHHHAHVAACLAENGRPLGAPPVLGLVLDGLGLGSDGTIWGGEFLLADYDGFERFAGLKPVAMPGGAQAVREPWRNLFAHIESSFGWTGFSARYSQLPVHAYLAARPLAMLDAMITRGLNSPRASSCGRLFDAVAAALGAARDRQSYEGEAAARLEALAAQAGADDRAYPFGFARARQGKAFVLDPAPMWRALFDDLASGSPAPAVALRFHRGLAQALARTAKRLAKPPFGISFDTVSLSGGCFQNQILLENTIEGLAAAGFDVLCQAKVPANDGGLSLGQAAVGAAKLMANRMNGRNASCVSAFQDASSS